MNNFLFDEQKTIEDMIKKRYVNNKNVYETINNITRYNYFVAKMDDQTNYNATLSYVSTNGDGINEENVYNIIDDCIKKSKKHPLRYIDKIIITNSEINLIESFNDIKKEKIVFVLLAVAKYYNKLNDCAKNTAYLDNSEICKLARVTIPSMERNVFMQFLYECEVVESKSYASSTGKKIIFVSNEDEDAALVLTEKDFKDLAYVYLAYKEPHKFRRCTTCGKFFRRKKDLNGNEIQKCKDCSKKQDDYNSCVKIKKCELCGRSYCVPIKDNISKMCDECYEIHRKIKKNEWAKSERSKDV